MLAALSTQQMDELGLLKEKFKDLFSEIEGFPPKRGIDHEIMLTGESSLPNSGLYRTTVEESEEIKKQITEIFER